MSSHSQTPNSEFNIAMPADTPPDLWSIWGAAWSERFADESASIQGAKAITSVANKAVPFSSATHVLDVGCGTGDLVAQIIASHSPLPKSCKIVASDLSPGMLTQTSARGAKEGWKGVEYKVLDAKKMTELEDESFSHVLSNFALYFLDASAQEESYRILSKGGVFVSTYMVKAQWMELLHPLSIVRPEKKIPGGYEAFGNPGVVKGIFEAAGFKDYEQVEIPVWCKFEDAVEIVDFILASMPFLNPITADLTTEERKRWRELMVEYVEREYPDKVLKGKAIVGMGRK